MFLKRRRNLDKGAPQWTVPTLARWLDWCICWDNSDSVLDCSAKWRDFVSSFQWREARGKSAALSSASNCWSHWVPTSSLTSFRSRSFLVSWHFSCALPELLSNTNWSGCSSRLDSRQSTNWTGRSVQTCGPSGGSWAWNRWTSKATWGHA